MAYATAQNVADGFRELTSDEQKRCAALLDEAAIIIDSYNADASSDAKRLVSCRMVRRVLGDGESAGAFPMGASQGSVSALGYAQTWTLASGSTGELYLAKAERHLLGVGNRIGVHSPLEALCEE